MPTQCNQKRLGFHPLRRREIRAKFDGGAISSGGGGLLLREVEKRTAIIRQFAACFTDYRKPDLIEHRVEELVAQRVHGLALGYENLTDHDELRNDPLLAVLVEKSNPKEALAGKSTLNRLELTKATASAKERYKEIVLDHAAVDRLLVELFVQAHPKAPKRSFWIWMLPTIRCRESRKVDSSMVITDTTAICHPTFSVGNFYYVPGCGRQILMRRPRAWKS
jgi:hypothetical protein